MNLSGIFSWFRLGRTALSDDPGKVSGQPGASIVDGAPIFSSDKAMQLSAVWACVSRRATTVASLPFFVYENKDGIREISRGNRLWTILHDSPNSVMTPMDFWRAMIMNHDLHGNAYAAIERDQSGEAIALWPLPAEQVEQVIEQDRSVTYQYKRGEDVYVYSQESMMHLRDIGNGSVGLSRIDYMRATTHENQTAVEQAAKMFGRAGKPTGMLMIDSLLKKDQRERILERFSEMQQGNSSRLFVLEANMKYQQLSLSPADQQLLESRKFGIEEICRFYDVPPVLIHHSNVTAWGSGIGQLVEGFHKFTIRPLVIAIEQAVRKQVMTSRQRATLTCEFSLDALLRSSLADRMEIYAKAVQNGIKSRNECRQLENDPPYKGGDIYTAQTNLAPLDMLGTIAGGRNASSQNPISQ